MKKHILLLSFVILASSCTDQMFSKTKEIVTTPAITPPSTSPIDFSGVKNVTNITESSAEIHWEEAKDAATYTVFLVTPESTPIVKEIVKAPASSVVLTGLTPNTHYKIFVRLMDNRSLVDTQREYAEFTTQEENNFSNTTSLLFRGNESIQLKESFKMFSHPHKFSISFWFKSESSQKEEVRLVSLHRGTGPSENLAIGIDGEKLFLTYINSNGETKMVNDINVNVADANWHHIVLSVGLEKLNLYLDGQSVIKQIDETLSSFGGHPAHLGAMTGYQKGFEGQMDEVSFWNSTLTNTDVASLYSGKGQSDLEKIQADLALWLRMGDDPRDSTESLIDQVSGAPMTANGIDSSDFLNETP